VGDAWPAWATEPVRIVDHDPLWAARARRLAADVGGILRPWLADEVQHVGSTAVPGLVAKPVLDLLAPIAAFGQIAQSDPVLARAGWSLVPPELDERPWRRFHVLPDGVRRVAHLHLLAADHPKVEQTLRFRDALRADPELAAAYAQVKRRAAVTHADDREAYTRAKTAFVEDVLARTRRG
jgi:GrpB-like predicted nucleotidyltransferase (UPF0157 family)